MMWLAQNQTPSYKIINRFRVNPNTDALIESLFIQFHSQCLKQNLIDDNSILLNVPSSFIFSKLYYLKSAINTDIMMLH